jgi:DNA-binding response OmpR family regulator
MGLKGERYRRSERSDTSHRNRKVVSGDVRRINPGTMARILIVEDHEPIQRILALTLRSAGHDALVAGDKESALELLALEQPDFLTLDLHLGDEDGGDVLREARKRGYDGAVIILSAFGAGSAAGDLEADAWMKKPINPDELIALIDKVAYVRSAAMLSPAARES